MTPIGSSNPFTHTFFRSLIDDSSESEGSNLEDSDVDMSSITSHSSEEEDFVTAFDINIAGKVYEVSVEHLPITPCPYPIELNSLSIEVLTDAIELVVGMKEAKKYFHLYSPEERLILDEISVIDLTSQPIKSLCKVWENVIDTALTRIEESSADDVVNAIDHKYFEALDPTIFLCIETIIENINPDIDIHEFIKAYAE